MGKYFNIKKCKRGTSQVLTFQKRIADSYHYITKHNPSMASNFSCLFPLSFFSSTEIPLRYSVHISIDIRTDFLPLYARNLHSQMDSLQWHGTQLNSNKQNDIPRKYSKHAPEKTRNGIREFEEAFSGTFYGTLRDIWFLDIARKERKRFWNVRRWEHSGTHVIISMKTSAG